MKTLRAHSIYSSATRIIPASKEHKLVGATKQPDGSMSLQFASGEAGILPAGDVDLQAFAVWTMLNSECTQ